MTSLNESMTRLPRAEGGEGSTRPARNGTREGNDPS